MKILRPHRVVSVLVAAVLVFGICLTGTHAWQSINQEALNETIKEINPGGRLHDDFNGTNKDVYVENFTDSNDGGVPIFARIRLDEYMEIGPDAGINRTNTGRDVIILGTDDAGNTSNINDVTTWTTHIPQLKADVCINGAPDTFHDYWGWDMGGSTIYMPTFNKNKDSLKADINGSYANTVDVDGDGTAEPYEDYVVYANGTQVNGDAVYDNDSNSVEDSGVLIQNETHTATSTRTATVLTMAEWMALNCPVGDYWVYDADGWAYWAAPIQPGEATGLLLDGIHMDREPSEDCYYAINVVAQFATRGDWGEADGTGFFDDKKGTPPSPEALFLLNQAAGMKPTVTISGVDGSIQAGETAQLTAELILSGMPYNDQSVVWSVSGSLGLSEGTAIDENGLLTVAADEEPGNVLMVKAISVADPRAWVSITIPVTEAGA